MPREIRLCKGWSIKDRFEHCLTNFDLSLASQLLPNCEPLTGMVQRQLVKCQLVKNVSPVSSELVGSQEIQSGHGQDDVRARAKSKSVLTSFDEFVFDQLDIGRVDILLKLLTNCLLKS